MSADLQRAHAVTPAEGKLGVIWAAMLATVVVYGALAYFVEGVRWVTLERELERWITIFLAMTAGLHVLVTLLLRQLIAALSKGNYVNYCVIRWSLQEGIAIYGLVLHFIGVGIGVTSIFFAVALLLLGASRPGATDRAVFVSQYR